MTPRQRLDRLLVESGHFATRARARDAVIRGTVTVDGAVITKPGQLVAPGATIASDDAAARYVSRAALKLVYALDAFDLDVSGLTALDIGASTGGFTEVLMERGAAHVTAIDVGHGQFAATLRAHPCVTVLEGVNARYLTREQVPDPPQVLVCDVSFISLEQALPASLALAGPDAILVALIKPQFEVGRENLGKGGIVRDEALHEATCRKISDWLGGEMGWKVVGIVPSPIAGGDGNREFVMVGRRFG